MKVKIEFTVDIDPEIWDMNFGTGTEPKVVRADVRQYVEHVATETIRDATGALR